MRTMAIALVASLTLGCGGPQNTAKTNDDSVIGDTHATSVEQLGFVYPESRREKVVDNYHGVDVEDPYRWLEDDNSDETKAWVEAQNKVTFEYLNSIPARDKIKSRLTSLWDYEKYGVPRKRAGRYFFSKNNGLQNQSVLYWTSALDSEPKPLLDPNTLSKDGTVALGGYSISNDGKYMAYGLSSAGSDWQEWKVRSIDSGEDTGDSLRWVKFSGATWSHDNKGFYYSRYPEPKKGAKLSGQNKNQKLMYHRLGTPQSADELVYSRPDKPKWGFSTEVTEDGRYLLMSVWKGTGEKNLVMFRDLKRRARKNKNGQLFTEIVGEFKSDYRFIGNDGSTLFFVTDDNAPRSRVVSIDARRVSKKQWKEVIPESTDTLRGVSLVGDRLIANYLSDAKTKVKVFDKKGDHVRDVEFPGIGSASGFGGEQKDTETFYRYTSYTAPGSIYRYDITSGKSTLYKESKVDFNGADYETKQIFFKSKDGTRVPMFITHKKGLKLDGSNPTILYGYGGFNVSLTPRFSVSNLVWMEMGGILAIPNLRGGGEYGREWHIAGTKLRKQNVFNDFIAAAEWLIQNKYTSSPKLAISGGSNGGLLVGAAMTQRPELFGAALPRVGVLDMLRFHKFTIGWAWIDDYGSSDNAREFTALYRYSPYHRLKVGTRYPATLVTTADHDDRVVPAHSFKFAAALQYAHRGETPTLIRIQTKAGHGAGKPTKMLIKESADVLGFLTKALGGPTP